MRYVRPAVPELLTLLQTELRRTTDALLVASAVDAAGVSLFREQVAAALDAGGGVTFVVSTASAAASVRDGLGLPNVGRLTVLVRDLPTSLNACVLTSVDGVMRGYVGSNDFRHAALAAGAPGVLLDGARDRGAVAELHEDLQALVDAVPRSAAGQPLVDLMQPTMDALERRHGRRAQQEGTFVPTGFADLDALTGGLLKGDLWVMTGRSGVGKSVLATDFLRSVAVRTGAHAALAQARDTREMTVQRILSAEARVPMYHLQTTGLTDEDWT
ncbi:MAG: DnaB-like helicase C-terminal domain-containing protein, partial [Mycobacteriaceae bacterium]